MFTKIHHVAYRVQKIDEAVQLIGQTFSLEPFRRWVEERSGREIAAFRVGQDGGFLELIQQLGDATSEQPLQIDHVAYAVKDLDITLKELRAKGVQTVREEPMVVEALGWRVISTLAESTLGLSFQLVDSSYELPKDTGP